MAQTLIRCAIYTRKSSEDGSEQEFSSIEAQREACAAYIASQKCRGWKELTDRYDDIGVSGGTLERPGLQRLLMDIEAGRINHVVVYKIDRLTRSLKDFSKLVDSLDAADVSFVSITQQFDTYSSMGRLTLNVLLSFAQFEREIAAERIRDKHAASKKKGLWMGGTAPLGYEPDGRSLKIIEDEARIVRLLFQLYLDIGCVNDVTHEIGRRGIVSPIRESNMGNAIGGQPLRRGRVLHILSNPIYTGRIRHKDKVYPGRHPAIVEQVTYDTVQEKMKARAPKKLRQPKKCVSFPLEGKIIDEVGDVLTSTHTDRKGKRYRFYISRRRLARATSAKEGGWRLPAFELENVVAKLITDSISTSANLATLVKDPDPTTVDTLPSAARVLRKNLNGNNRHSTLRKIVDRGRIEPSRLKIVLNVDVLAHCLNAKSRELNKAALTLGTNFDLRQSGRKKRILLPGEHFGINQRMVSRLSRGWAWLEEIKRGKSIKDIAVQESLSQKYVYNSVDMALLSPEIVISILEGKQPPSLTIESVRKITSAMDWNEQRNLYRNFP